MERAATRALLMLLAFLLTVLLAAPGVLAETRTIDDTNGDSVTGAQPTYSGRWEDRNHCSFCSAFAQYGSFLDMSQISDGTWHASQTAGNSVSLTFTGTSIRVFFVVPLVGEYTACSFLLDGQSSGAATIQPTNQPPYVSFNHQVFGVDNLDNIQHTLVISVIGLVVFDYATYEVDSPPSPSPSQPPPPPPPTSSSSDPTPSPSNTAPDDPPSTTSPPAPGPGSSDVSSAPTASPAPASITSTTGATSVSAGVGGSNPTEGTGPSVASLNSSYTLNTTASGHASETAAGTGGGSGPGISKPNVVEPTQTSPSFPTPSFDNVSGFVPPTDYPAPHRPSPSQGGGIASDHSSPDDSSGNSTSNGSGSTSSSAQVTGASASKRSSVPIGAIIGAVVGGLLVLVVIVILLVYRRRRRSRLPPSAEFLQAPALGKRLDATFAIAPGSGLEAAPFSEKGGLDAFAGSSPIQEQDVDYGPPSSSPAPPTIAAARRAIQAGAAGPLARLTAGAELPDTSDASGRAALLRDEVSRTLSAYHVEPGSATSSARGSAASPSSLSPVPKLVDIADLAHAAEGGPDAEPEPTRLPENRASLVSNARSSLKYTWPM